MHEVVRIDEGRGRQRGRDGGRAGVGGGRERESHTYSQTSGFTKMSDLERTPPSKKQKGSAPATPRHGDDDVGVRMFARCSQAAQRWFVAISSARSHVCVCVCVHAHVCTYAYSTGPRPEVQHCYGGAGPACTVARTHARTHAHTRSRRGAPQPTGDPAQLILNAHSIPRPVQRDWEE